MKKWKNFLLSLIAITGFVACSDDEPGLPPVVDNSDINIELKRDTIDSYRISIPIVSEEGLAKVSLVDNASGSTLDEVISFSNPKDYIYNYDFDLTPYTDNTVVMLTLKIEDKEGQMVDKKITLTVKKFSELDVRFATEGTISTWFENCNVKLTVLRGLIPLKELQVYVGTTLSSTFDLSLDAEQSKYDLNVHVEGLKDGDNTVKVVVIDEKEQKFEKSIIITRTGQKTWKDLYGVKFGENSIIEFNGMDMNGDRDFTEDGKLYRLGGATDPMGMKYEFFDFTYGQNGMVETVAHRKQGLDFSTGSMFDEAIVYTYVYGENEQVTKVTMEKDGNTADYITNVIYENGIVMSYKIEGQDYDAKYIEKDGEMVRVDYLDSGLSDLTFDFSEKSGNTLYLDKLPVLVPFEFNGFLFSQYFYNPYHFSKVKDNDTVTKSYTVGPISYDSDIEMTTQIITWVESGVDMSVMYIFGD